ncbi:hypothetical protein B0H14DRAFT_2584482 [Mycena olivaceomarginata]|nr:hypothetical protein B0H14DRAFT_2584482 [Mycena olivaceomarginata]
MLFGATGDHLCIADSNGDAERAHSYNRVWLQETSTPHTFNMGGTILDTDLRREQLFLLLAVGYSAYLISCAWAPPAASVGRIHIAPRRRVRRRKPNTFELPWVGDQRLVPWGLSEVNMKAERDRTLSGKGMFWGPWGWTQVYPWVLALSSQPVPGPANMGAGTALGIFMGPHQETIS